MGRKYVHFTSLEDAKKIVESGQLWQASFGPAGSVFAVVQGGSFVPNVQMTGMGRPKIRSAAVVFETDYLPDVAFPEEVMWHMDSLPIKNAKIVSPKEGASLLNDSLSVDDDFDMLEIPVHPAFNIWGDWTRMPENWQPWVPGVDNQKYLAAKELWIEDQNIKGLEELWNDGTLEEPVQESVSLGQLIKTLVKEVLEQSNS